MTPSPDQTQPNAGWRRDGRNVPGNQQGGANGRYGRYGQNPQMRIPQNVSDDISRSAQGFQQGMDGGAAQMGQNAWHIAQGVHNRYGAQGRQNHAMNSMRQGMRHDDMQRNADQMQQPVEPSPMSAPADPQMPPEGVQQQPSVEPMQSQTQPDMAPSPTSYVMRSSQPIDGAPQGMSGLSAHQQPPAPATSQPAPSPTPTASTAQPASSGQSSMSSPFGQMHFDQNAGQSQSMMAKGGIVTHPTRAILGENGPEAVVPLDNPNASVTMGMFSPRRYRANTGPSSLHHPIPPMAPASLDPSMHKPSGWKRWNVEHGKV